VIVARSLAGSRCAQQPRTSLTLERTGRRITRRSGVSSLPSSGCVNPGKHQERVSVGGEPVSGAALIGSSDACCWPGVLTAGGVGREPRGGSSNGRPLAGRKWPSGGAFVVSDKAGDVASVGKSLPPGSLVNDQGTGAWPIAEDSREGAVVAVFDWDSVALAAGPARSWPTNRLRLCRPRMIVGMAPIVWPNACPQQAPTRRAPGHGRIGLPVARSGTVTASGKGSRAPVRSAVAESFRVFEP
jgi:hypothetical protein